MSLGWLLQNRNALLLKESAELPEGEEGGGSNEGLLSGRAPENAIIIRRDTPVDVQNEDRFSPMNTFAFSPLAQDYFSIDNGVLALILFKLAKQDPARLASLMEKYMKNVTDILTSIVESGKTHPITALNASTAFAVVAHRFGIITDSGYLKMADQTRHIIDTLQNLAAAGIALGGLETLTDKTHIDLTGLAAMAKKKP